MTLPPNPLGLTGDVRAADDASKARFVALTQAFTVRRHV
jgi:hypothetical protein